MKTKSSFFSGLALVLLLLFSFGWYYISRAGSDQAPSAAQTSHQRPGETIVVTSHADSGPGTLRQALLDAQSGDTITFDTTVFPPSAPVTISLASALPQIGQGNLTIDGSNAGVILDGSSFPTGTWVLGLEIHSDGNTVLGLQIVSFPGPGIGLYSGSRNNTIGGNRAVGTAPLGQGNLISRNGNVGIGLGDSSFNTIRGNYIGTNPSGTEACFDFDLQAGTVTGTTCHDCTVEIFSDSDDEGAHFEGQTTADASGAFAFSKGAPLIGPRLTATVTDVDGTTSEFSLPTSGRSDSDRRRLQQCCR